MEKNRDFTVTKKIFAYDNYRFFLREYFQEMKRCKNAFSHRFFARKAGFSSSSFLSHVMDGKRRLTPLSLKKVIKGMGLRGRAATYFETLVLYNQTESIEERGLLAKKLERMRMNTQFYKVKKRQYIYYEKWFYSVIRELAAAGDFKGNWSQLAASLSPPITPTMARNAVDTLVSIGMLQKNGDGSYSQVAKAVTAEEVPHVITRKTRKDFIHLAEEAMENFPVSERHMSSSTVLLSEEMFNKFIAQIDEFRRTMISEAMDATKPTKVYQFNFQAFPVSKPIDKKGANEK